ncbi:DUF1049 domain-containing protein [Halomonas sp. 1513]|nr:lipopolysaccharide assembly protein LapA domain-containing protein [Halomonas sp. 1513]APX93354.1 DUF1049 domain-containing protein [Halomonas sp. 1513]
MDKVYLILKILITLIIVVLFVQNIRVVEINFLAWSLSLPLALSMVLIYVLGMVSGKSLMALLKRLRSREPRR